MEEGFTLKNKRIIIIGAGIAGLATGCYARMNGYETIIYEMHDKPGGVCTSWKRKGYTFDYCIHNLAGSGKRAALRKVWDELGALDGTDIIDHEMFVRVEGPKGETLNLYTDLDRLEKHLLNIAPEDAVAIKKYIDAGRALAKADVFAMSLGEKKRWLGMLPRLPAVMKWSKVPMESYAQRFTNPFLRQAFPHLQYDVTGPEMPLLPNLIFLGGFEIGDLGWPRGGSLEFSRRIARRFDALGGEMNYLSFVEKIIVNNGTATGIRLADGSEQYADIVVSAADGYFTIYNMLDGSYTNELIDAYYDHFVESQSFGLQVYLGLNRDLTNEPHALTLILDQAITLEGRGRNSLYLEIFDSATGMAPEGKSVIKVVTEGNYNYWRILRKDMAKYMTTKDTIAETVINVLEKRFPGIRKQVEAVDVTTPVSVQRYTNNFHGLQPWPAPKGDFQIMQKGLSKTLPGLNNFFMVGQWAGAMIGVSTAAVTGRNLVKQICKKDGKRFVIANS
ncbi:MAG: NAD(P)/FAD-dependent oxidoreductase [Firmicutes bacterium]|nr:NAD(P)/FAD-dependent oxidoreductase [Bacillota bacterium]